MNVILSPGIIPYEYYSEILNKPDIHAYFVVRNSVVKRLEKINPQLEIINLESFVNARKIKNAAYVSEHYNEVYNQIVDDHLTWEIDERVYYRKYPWQNNYFSSIKISNLITNCIDVICTIKPEFVFFHTTPHGLLNLILGRTAEILGIPVYYSKRSSLPWRCMLAKGIKESEIVKITDEKDEKILIQRFIDDNSGSYDKAIPSYEKDRLKKRGGNIWSWSNEIKLCFEGKNISQMILRTLSIPRKRKAYVYYKKHTSYPSKCRYVVVFLHFQPERSSLPEGLYFSQQFHLIRTLRMGLPADVSIYVKEHPSIYTRDIDVRYRSVYFYQEILKIDNTRLIDMEVDSFALMKDAIAVATITGTPGVQALIRGISCLSFGNATYNNAPDCYIIKESKDVQSAFQTICKRSTKEIVQNTQLYLANLTKESISGIDEDETKDAYDITYKLKADGRILTMLIDQYNIVVANGKN